MPTTFSIVNSFRDFDLTETRYFDAVDEPSWGSYANSSSVAQDPASAPEISNISMVNYGALEEGDAEGWDVEGKGGGDPPGETDDDYFATLDDMPMRVCDHVFIGSLLAEHNELRLAQHGITHILQIGKGLSPSHETLFRYRSVEVSDTQGADIVRHFPVAFNFIDDAVREEGGVLVHCVAGVSRSAAVCIGYVMHKHGIDYESALHMVKKSRPCINPNVGFRKQLQEFQKLGSDPAKWVSHSSEVEDAPSDNEGDGFDPYAPMSWGGGRTRDDDHINVAAFT